MYRVFPQIIAGDDYNFFAQKGSDLLEGGNYFKYFCIRGAGAVIRGRQLIEGQLLFKEIGYFYCTLIAKIARTKIISMLGAVSQLAEVSHFFFHFCLVVRDLCYILLHIAGKVLGTF